MARVPAQGTSFDGIAILLSVLVGAAGLLMQAGEPWTLNSLLHHHVSFS
jgi:hypothetical protein